MPLETRINVESRHVNQTSEFIGCSQRYKSQDISRYANLLFCQQECELTWWNCKILILCKLNLCMCGQSAYLVIRRYIEFTTHFQTVRRAINLCRTKWINYTGTRYPFTQRCATEE